MRGRTNVTQRSGTVPVNGQIKEAVVESGNVISVGDFVSYVPSTEMYDISDDNNIHSNSVPEKVGNYFIYLSNGSIYSFSLVNGVMVLSSKYNSYIITKIAIYNNFIFCIAKISTGSSSSSYKYRVFKLKFENGSFEKINEVSLTGEYVWDIAINSGYVVVFGFEYKTTSSQYKTYVHFKVFNVNDMSIIEGFEVVEVSSLFVYETINVICKENKICILNYGNASYTPSTSISEILEVIIEVDFALKSININSIVPDVNFPMNGGRKVIPVGIFGNKICYIYNNGSDMNGSLYYLVFDLEGLTYSKKFLVSANTQSYRFKGSNYDDLFILNYFIYNSNDNIFLAVKFNSDTGELVFTSSNYVADYSVMLGTIIYDNFIIYDIGSYVKGSTTSIKERILTISSDGTEINQSVNKNKVKSYSGSAMGFAKTGGNAGDTIQIYVPNES